MLGQKREGTREHTQEEVSELACTKQKILSNEEWTSEPLSVTAKEAGGEVFLACVPAAVPYKKQQPPPNAPNKLFRGSLPSKGDSLCLKPLS